MFWVDYQQASTTEKCRRVARRNSAARFSYHNETIFWQLWHFSPKKSWLFIGDNAIIVRLAKTLARRPQVLLSPLTSGVTIASSRQSDKSPSGFVFQALDPIVPTRPSL